MDVLRTPDDRFENLPDFPWEPHYTEVPAGDGSGTALRIAHVEDGPDHADPVLLLHGEPSWSFLYRWMIPILVQGGHRVLAPDLVGFGRSDKPAAYEDYSYQRHVDWVWAWVEAQGLEGITLFCQDWGGLIGLRLVAEHPDRFARVVAANTFMPTGDQPLGEAFDRWCRHSQETEFLDVGKIVQSGTVRELDAAETAAYDAPFPDETYKAGARIFPSLVPARPDDPASDANRKAWEVLSRWEKPFLTAFGDSDPITAGADQVLQAIIPGARGQSHVTVHDAGHFCQEDRGAELAAIIDRFVGSTVE